MVWRSARICVIAVAIAAVIPACSGGSAPVTLHVEIRDLPANAKGNVVISGPGAFHAQVSRTVTLAVRRATYRIDIRGVPIGASTYYPQNLVMSVGAPGSVIIDYAEQVPATTKVLDGRNLRLAPGTLATSSSITFARGSPGAALTAGEVLVVNPGPAFPNGLIGRVRGVSPGATAVTVMLGPAGLRDAIPRGAWHTRLPIDPTGSIGLKSGALTCSVGASVSATASASLNGYVDFDFAWGFATPNYVKLVGGVTENGSAKETVKNAGECKLTADSSAYPLPSFTFPLGPFVIEVNPEFVVHGEASGTFTSGPQFGFTQSAWAKAGFSWGTPDGSNQDLHPIAGAGASFKAIPPVEAPSEDDWAGFGPQLDFNIDFINGGPFINMLLGINIKNDQQSDGTYKYTGTSQLRFSVGVRANWGPLNFSVSQPFTLQGSTLFEGTYGTPSPTPTPSPISSPRPAVGCKVLAPTADPIDLAAALPGRALTLHSAVANQNGALTQPPGTGPASDQPGSAASCQWLGPATTPSPPYETPYSINAVLSIVPYIDATVAQQAWNRQAGPPVPGLSDPTGIGDAARWEFPGIEDANATLSVRAGRFLFTIATTETGSTLKADTEALARAVAHQLPH